MKLVRQADRLTLQQCLRLLGVKPLKRYANNQFGYRLYPSCKPSFSYLYDLYDAARARFLKLCRTLRPDLNINHEQSVALLVIWARTKMLFARRGIET